MKTNVLSAILSLFLASQLLTASAEVKKSVTRPTFADYKVSIVDYGAKNDVAVKNTAAINKAIKAVSEHGGGMVVIPAGYWLTGPIEMQSNVNLFLERNAFVSFSSDISDYMIVDTDFEGSKSSRCISPINGKGLKNVAITGYGVFDGSGDRWRPIKKGKLTAGQWKEMTSRPGSFNDKKDIWYPDSNAEKIRPVMLQIEESENVLLEGVTFKNSPAWCLHPLLCKNLTINAVSVYNPWYAQNGDALDVESCKDVVVTNSMFDAGDDAICIKSGKDEAGRKRGVPCENVYISNNTVLHGHGGFVIGSEMSGGVKNIYIGDCTFIGTDVGLRFKSTRGRGGVVEDITIERINMKQIPNEAITMDLYYSANGAPSTRTDVNEGTPRFRNITMSDLYVEGAGTPIYMNGLPEMPLENIVIKGMHVSNAKNASSVKYAKNVTITGYEAADEDKFNVVSTTGLTVNGKKK